MGSRQQLAAAIAANLPADTMIVADPRSLSEDAHYDGILQLFRTDLGPANYAGKLVQTFELWALTQDQDPATRDDRLDDFLDLIVEALEQIPNLLWTTATRADHRDGFTGYRFTITVTGEITEE